MSHFPDEPGIYRCYCSVNGRSYVGQTQSLLTRQYHHTSKLRNHRHENQHLQRAWDKYGEDAFEWEILELCSADDLDERETFWIEELDSFRHGFNYTAGGGGLRGYTQSDEIKAKHAVVARNLWTPERRAQQSEKMKGTGNPLYGRKGPLNSAYGKDHSGNFNGMFGKHQTEHAKELNRQAHLGKKNANSKPVICIERNEFFWSMGEAKRATGCDDTTITRCCRGIKKTCGGYHWRYATEEEIELHNSNYMTG